MRGHDVIMTLFRPRCHILSYIFQKIMSIEAISKYAYCRRLNNADSFVIIRVKIIGFD